MATVPTPSPFQSLIAGTISGMTAILVCHPLDVIRTRLQLDSNLSFMQAVRVGSLYSGFKTPFFAQGFYKAVIFSANTVSLNYIFRGKRTQENVLISGCIAGTINSLVVAPVEMVRTTQILRARLHPGESILETVKTLIESRGVHSLWAAALPTILRDGPGMGLYMLAFEQAKPFLAEFDSFRDHLLFTKMTAGASAGIVFWTWAIPIDTIKAIIESRIQSAGTTAAQDTSMRSIFIRSLKSLPIAYLRGIPSAAVTLTTYDLIMAEFAKRNV